jgi:dynein heavy chain
MAATSDLSEEVEPTALANLQCIEWVKARITLAGYDPAMWREDHQVVVSDFLATTGAVELKRLYVFMATGGELTIQYNLPGDRPREMMYFLRDSSKEVDKESVDTLVQYGTVAGDAMESLLRLMVSVYVPVFTNNKVWPESVRKEFSGHLQKFMASLTETAHELQGSTILYVPTENIESVEAAANAKDQLQRLESTVIHWTRQIQEVVNNQESGADSSDDSGPLAEIQFWRSRTVDLSGIREQLDMPGVRLIVSVLEATNSTYLLPFTKLADEIKEKTQTAEDNCRFLQLLQEPCEQLSSAEPKDIPALLPHLLNCIRMIWSTSTFYRIPERLTRLLRKVSNEMIQRCRAKISLEEIFDGDAEKAIVALKESIECIEQWRKSFDKTVELVERKGGVWVSNNSQESGVDSNNVFAHVFAFKQRCSDLLEVCEGRLQFAPRYAMAEDGSTARPVFRGPRGTEIQKSLEDIEGSFAKDLEKLRNINYDILDVKATGWHDDHTAFKNALRQLEAMTENAIQSACALDSLPNVAAGVELLEAFQMLAHRDKIKMKVDTMTAEVYSMFLQDMDAVKKEFDSFRQNPPLHHAFPKYSGAAMWAKCLNERITVQMDVLNTAHYLNPGREAQEARERFRALSDALEEFRSRMHKNWSSDLGIDLSKRMDIKLLQWDSSGDKLLVVNFDPHLLRFYSETGYWERQKQDIPYSKDVTDLHQNAEKTRNLRENVGLVVRDYNLIISSLTLEEKKLFQERIFHLDRKISNGLTKFTWAQRPAMIMQYVKDCRKYCREVYSTVTNFKANNDMITKNCKKMSSELLIKIERKRVYDNGSFQEEQAEHRRRVQEILERSHNEIIEVLNKSKEIFAHDSPEVQSEWIAYCASIDQDIENALRMMVKKSLQEISRAINGETKTDVSPLFKMNVLLEDNRVSLQPSSSALSQMVNGIASELITGVKVVPRVTELINETQPNEDGETEKLPSFFERILNDKDILEKTMVAIMEGMTGNVDGTTKYAAGWDKYKTIWERNKEKHIERYASQNHDVAAFETDIMYYRKLAEEVKSEETYMNINFVKLDCSMLKQQLTEHCSQWETCFTTLLNDTARKELETLREMFESHTKFLSEKPRDLDHLAQEVNLQQSLTKDLDNIEARLKPLNEQYKALEQFEVQISEEELTKVSELPDGLAAFQQMLQDSEVKLEKSKSAFRVQLNNNLEEFAEQVQASRVDFTTRGPFKAEDTNPETAAAAKISIAEFRAKCAAERAQQDQMKPGMDVFGMPFPEDIDPTLSMSESELVLLDKNWNLVEEWSGMWDGWKYGKFKEIDADDMEAQAAAFGKRILKLGKEDDKKAMKWGVWNQMKATVEQFKKSLPMITDLKNPGLRQRHWDQLIEKVGQTFDPTSDDFTLEKVFDLKLPLYVDDVATISSNANKELAIEKALVEIEAAWATIEFFVAPYKNLGHHRMAATEELFQQLEDNQVGISTMKASKFSIAFREKLDYWEKALSMVSEVTDQGLNVQRQWMYLENIFIGSEDIKRQLPTEAAMFESVNSNWKFVMDRMVKEVNAVKASHEEGLLDMLNEMDEKLTKIQKSLDEYLEKKRMCFPRFYFISSDDLLEILGQSKNPEAVQPHFKKMFEGIKKLTFNAPQGARKTYEATAFHAADKETLDYKEVLIIDGQVEDWLNKVEQGMLVTIHHNLLQTYMAARQKSIKKDKWVKTWPGQLLITSGQMKWTADVEKALTETEAGNKQAMRGARKTQARALSKFADMLKIRPPISKIDRNKVMGLLIIEVHSRDVLEKLVKSGISSAGDFDWLQQLRCYWDKETDDCLFRITNTKTPYGHEYQGNNGRLVVTPLTDRCYMTLTTALNLRRGGLPQGPAGTGKTETVKDLSKAIAKYVIVFNCSDGLDFKSMGRMFSGLAQSGSWSCFDEFNRINEEVLSVVAMQIMSVLDAIKAKLTTFMFEGTMIPLNWGCGIFVTMNPAGAGYEGRSELPENLKAVLRPISMMAPELALIMEVMMFSNGFSAANSKDLGKKMYTLYSLCVQQLSKQPHYDFGLRNISGVMRAAGALKQAEGDLTEDVVLFRTLRDMNMPKYIKSDAALFMMLMQDIFQGVEPAPIDYGNFGDMIREDLIEHGYQATPYAMKKTIELFEAKNTRHCVMLVGDTGAAKSVALNTLARVKTKMCKRGVQDFNLVKQYVLNPKAFSDPELYGFADVETREWTDGVLAVVMRNICSDDKPDEKWLVLDGPVDTLWIESMNTVMDDNKMLTLMSGERIGLPTMVTLVFEVQDLLAASPATVSRAGMIYFDTADMGWAPNFDSWLLKKRESGQEGKELADIMVRLFEKFVTPLLIFKMRFCKDTVYVADQQQVIALMRLIDVLMTIENGVDPKSEEYVKMIEMWFVYCFTWSIGATVDEDSRKKMDGAIREIDATIPTKGLIYDYYVDVEKKAWRMWESKLNANWKPHPATPFYAITVPTTDTIRNQYILGVLTRSRIHTLLVGGVGNGKTVCAEAVLSTFDEDRTAKLIMNFSAQTSSPGIQKIMEGKLDKRTKDTYGPPAGRNMITMVDDMNMPQKDKFGSHPPLELLRMWIQHGMWYDREKHLVKKVQDMQLLALMGPAGGGRTEISLRMQSQFHIINVTTASDADLTKIFGTLLNNYLTTFDEEEVKTLGDTMTQILITVFHSIQQALLPTPTKPVYLFNMRDLAKVVQGVLQGSKDYFDTRDSVLRLFVHETTCVFGDRLNSLDDRKWFKDLLDSQLSSIDAKWSSLYKKDGVMTNFGSFMTEIEPRVYHEFDNAEAVKTLLEEKLEDYNLEGGVPMDLVLFKDAVDHVCKINRRAQPTAGQYAAGWCRWQRPPELDATGDFCC